MLGPTVKVSIIIPVYNAEKYLKECLNSVINQSLREIELICINDGSRDRSLDILKEYKRIDKRVVVLNQENRGVGYTRNRGINISSGEFVMFMDPDDWYPNRKVVETLYKKAIENQVLVCGGSFSEYIYGRINTLFRDDYCDYVLKKEGKVNYSDYQFDYGFTRFIYKREFLTYNKIYFPEYVRFQDPPFFTKVMIHAKVFYAVPIITYCYRRGNIVNWDARSTNDLVKGLIDNLIISGKYRLSKLHILTVNRFNNEYIKPILKNINRNNLILLELILKANSLVDISLLKNNRKCNEFMLEPLKRSIEEHDIEELKKKLKILRQDYDNVINSKSYKIGKDIMHRISNIVSMYRMK